MFVREQVKAKDIKLIESDIENYRIKVLIGNKEYLFDLINTNLSFLKVFYLDGSYEQRKFFDIRNGDIMDNIFE